MRSRNCCRLGVGVWRPSTLLRQFLIALLLSIGAPVCHSQHPAPGTKIVHFGRVDEGIYKGSKPKNDADFRFLQSKHIRYIMDLNFMPLFAVEEKKKAREYGMAFIRIPMNASPIPPSSKHVERALRILRDKRFHPIYFHCELGRDRTSLVAALYDMYFRGVSQEDAWEEMKRNGYKDWFGIHGLKSYLFHHPTMSPAARANRPH